jgi:hypothetical protein
MFARDAGVRFAPRSDEQHHFSEAAIHRRGGKWQGRAEAVGNALLLGLCARSADGAPCVMLAWRRSVHAPHKGDNTLDVAGEDMEAHFCSDVF